MNVSMVCTAFFAERLHVQILLCSAFRSRLVPSVGCRLLCFLGEVPVLQHGCFSYNLTDVHPMC